jgi:hypothetical protein
MADVPSMMEEMAKQIRDGRCGNVTAGAAVFLRDDGEVVVCGWGRDTDPIHSVGLLTTGAAWLANRPVHR